MFKRSQVVNPPDGTAKFTSPFVCLPLTGEEFHLTVRRFNFVLVFHELSLQSEQCSEQ